MSKTASLYRDNKTGEWVNYDEAVRRGLIGKSQRVGQTSWGGWEKPEPEEEETKEK